MLTREQVAAHFSEEQPDMELLVPYLVKRAKSSRKSYEVISAVLRIFYQHVGKSILELTFDDVDNYIAFIDDRDVTLSTKKSHYSNAKSYYYAVYDRLRRQGVAITDVFPRRNPKFTPNVKDAASVLEDKKDGILTDEQMHNLLVQAKTRKPAHYIALLLLRDTGARVMEILTIRMENINIKERYFITGLENSARKSNKPLLFFIPKRTALKLGEYMMGIKGIWLFPSSQSRSGHAEYDQLRSQYGKMHVWRKSLITRRLDMGCPAHVSEMLVNHAPSSVEFKHYYKKDVSEKRDLYDRYYPYATHATP